MHEILDFTVGQICEDGLGNQYKIIDVSDKSIKCEFKDNIINFNKILYCGVYAAVKFDKVYFKSTKIISCLDETIDTPERIRKFNHGESFVKIFKENYESGNRNRN